MASKVIAFFIAKLLVFKDSNYSQQYTVVI